MKRFNQYLADSPRVVHGRSGMVVSQHYAATEIGADILRDGGTAADAAIAMALALGVCEPWMSGLGGVGYIMVAPKDETPHLVHFPAIAPEAVRPEDYPIVGPPNPDHLFPWPQVKADRNVIGARAVCAPRLAGGLALLHEQDAIMPWSSLVQPAIELARQGLCLDWYTQLILASTAGMLQADPDASAFLLNEKGTPHAVGWTAASRKYLPQDRLVDTLSVLASDGPHSLIHGDIAHSIINDIAAKGGVLNMRDFRHHPPSIIEADSTELPAGQKIWTVPGLSGGCTVADLLNSWAGQCPDKAPHIQRALRAQSGVAIMRERLNQLGGAENQAHPSCTTSFCVIDSQETMISATLTLVSLFGAKLLSPRTGLFLNNAMSWFDVNPQAANSIAPLRQPLSNMAPTIAELPRGGRLALAAAGGRRIPPAVSQILAGLLLDRQPLEHAISAPRLDFQANGEIIADARIPTEEHAFLSQLGPVMIEHPTIYPYYFGLVSAAMQMEDGQMQGACEAFCPNALSLGM